MRNFPICNFSVIYKNSMFNLNKLRSSYFLVSVGMIVVGIIVALLIGGVNVTQSKLEGVKEHDSEPFPQVSISGFEKGLDLSTELKRGKTLLVYISTECRGCKTEAELLSKSNLFEDHGIRILLVGYESKEKLQEFKNAYKLIYPVFFDKDLRLRNHFNIRVVPANYLVIDGKLQRSWLGAPQSKHSLYEKLGLELN